MNSPGNRRSALIIAGAAGKGPYAAGALTKLAEDDRFDVRKLVGASSGALNAAVYAAGLRVGEERDAALQLRRLWRERAHWDKIITHDARVEVVRQALEPYKRKARKRDVSLDVIVASLDGHADEQYRHRRFERTCCFETDAFARDGSLDEIAEACVVSSTLPLIFPPRAFASRGQFWDGGIVNNTPIGRALKGHPDVDHMIVITPDSDHVEHEQYSWLGLKRALNRLLEMVIEERLSRDLCEAKSFNDELLKLADAGFDLEKVRQAMGWKLLQFVEIRPERDLPGSLGSGFLSSRLRGEYIEVGEQTAAACLKNWRPRAFAAASKNAA